MEFIKSILSDELGLLSSKRLIALLTAVFLIFDMIVDLFSSYSASNEIIYAVSSVCLVAMGATSLDKKSNIENKL